MGELFQTGIMRFLAKVIVAAVPRPGVLSIVRRAPFASARERTSGSPRPRPPARPRLRPGRAGALRDRAISAPVIPDPVSRTWIVIGPSAAQRVTTFTAPPAAVH